MTVSAYWHGIYPGYYLSFLTIPPVVLAEDLMIAAFRKDKPQKQQERFDWIWWFFKMRFFDYMNMGFVLLSLSGTIGYWSSIYFTWHIVTIIFIIIGMKYKPKRKKEQDDDIQKKKE